MRISAANSLRRGRGRGRFVMIPALLALIAGLTLMLAGGASGLGTCTDTYTGQTNGDWNVPGNWTTSGSVNAVPTSSDVACIPSGVTVDVDEGDVASVVQGTSASSTGSVDIEGGTLTLYANGSALTNLTVAGGTLQGNSAATTLSVAGSFDEQVGDIEQMTITQSGSGSFGIDGADGTNSSTDPALSNSSITTSTTGAVTISNTGLVNFGNAESTITSTVEPIQIGAGTYSQAYDYASGFTLSAPGFDLTGGSADLQLASLVVTGSDDSDIQSTLTVEALDVGGGDEINLGSSSSDGITIIGGSGQNGTLAGTVDGSGTFTENGGSTTVTGTGFEAALAVEDGTFELNAATASVGSVSSTGGTLSFGASADTLADSGAFLISGGTLQGPGTLTVAGTYDQQASDIEQMTITQTGSSSFSIDGTGNAFLGNSSVTTSTSGSVSLTNTDFNSQDNARSYVTSTVSPISIGAGTYGAAYDYNSGYTLSAPGFDLSSGTADLEFGSLVVTGSDDSDIQSTLTVEALDVGGGDEINLGSSSSDGITIIGGSGQNGTLAGTVDGSGTFTENGGSTTVTGTGFEAALAVEDGTFELNAATASPGSVALTGGTLSFGAGGDTLADQGAFSISGGALLQGPGTMTVAGSFDEQVGDVDQMTITQSGSGSFGIDGADGTNSSTDPALSNSSITTSTTGTVTISNTGLFNGGNATSTITSTVEPIQIGAGTYSQAYNYAAGFTLSAPGFDLSAGTTDLEYEQLVQTGGTTTVAAADTLEPEGLTLTGGTLSGTGTIDGPVTNTAGIVSPGDAPGTLYITGNYSQGAGGTLQIEEDGTSDVSLLYVGGTVSLGGTLAMEPNVGYAGSAAPGDEVAVLHYVNGDLSGTFSQVTSSPSLQDGETYSQQYPAGDVFADVDALVGAAQPPANTVAPTVGGTAQQGDQVSVSSNGTWMNNPTSYSYQWEDCTSAAETTCSNISGGTSSTYTLQSTDVGKYVTVLVTATNVADTPVGQLASNSVGPVQAPAVTPPQGTAPATTAGPSISGTPLPGDMLTCNPGTWTGSPTFTYAWQLNGTGIAGQIAPTLVVTILDEGGSITCAVTGSNAFGTDTVTTVGSIVSTGKSTLTCPKPSGAVTSTSVGPFSLGESKTKARKWVPRYHVIGYGFDNFCLYGGWGIRGAYIKNKFAILLTANPFYGVDSVTPGETIAYAKTKLKLGKLIVIGKSDWYIAKGGGKSNYVLTVSGGLVQGVGIADKADTATYAEQKKFLERFYGT